MDAFKQLTTFLTTPRYIKGVNTPSVIPRMTHQTAMATQVDPSRSGRPHLVTQDDRTSLARGMTSSHFVYGCIQLISAELSRPELMVECRTLTKGGAESWQTVPMSPLNSLFVQPNHAQTWDQFITRFVTHLTLTGNAIALKVRSELSPAVRGGKPRPVKELWLIQPSDIKPVLSSERYISHYEYRSGTVTINIPVEDVIHSMYPNPSDPFWGLSPLVALRPLMTTESLALSWWSNSIQNRAVKDGFLRYRGSLSEAEYSKIKLNLMEQVVGPYNSRLPLVIDGDVEFTPTSNNAVEMDFIDLRKMTREEICGVLRVPPILLGILEHSSYNNIKEARLSLWQDNLLTLLGWLCSTFRSQLLPEFHDPIDYRIGYDLSSIPSLLSHLVSMAPAVETYWRMGVPFNDLNRRFGLGFQPIDPEVGDVSWIPSGVQLGEHATNDPASSPVYSGGFVDTSTPTPDQPDQPQFSPNDPDTIAEKFRYYRAMHPNDT